MCPLVSKDLTCNIVLTQFCDEHKECVCVFCKSFGNTKISEQWFVVRCACKHEQCKEWDNVRCPYMSFIEGLCTVYDM